MRGGVDLRDPVLSYVGDPESAILPHQRARRAQRIGHGTDLPVRDPADPVVAGIRDKALLRRADRYAGRETEPCLFSGTVRSPTGAGRWAGACNRGALPTLGDPPAPVV